MQGTNKENIRLSSFARMSPGLTILPGMASVAVESVTLSVLFPNVPQAQEIPRKFTYYPKIFVYEGPIIVLPSSSCIADQIPT